MEVYESTCRTVSGVYPITEAILGRPGFGNEGCTEKTKWRFSVVGKRVLHWVIKGF